MLEAITSKTMEAVSRGHARRVRRTLYRVRACGISTASPIRISGFTSRITRAILNALVIWSLLPHDVRMLTHPVAARDYWERGRLKPYLAKRVFGAMLIDRQNIKVHESPVDLMLREIGDRYSIIVFPEGHRNTGSEIDEFKSGLYYLAKKRPDLELVPVHIDNLNRVLPRGEFLPVPLLSCVTFGPPIWLEAGEPKAEFLKKAREAVRKLKDV